MAEQVLNLSKGQSLSLEKKDTSVELVAGLGWQETSAASEDLDLDAFAIVHYTQNGVEKTELCYFNNKTLNGVKIGADDRSGGGKVDEPNENIDVILDKVRKDATKVTIGVGIWEGARNFRVVKDAFIDIREGNKVKCRYNLSDFASAKSILAGEFVKSEDKWAFKALGTSLKVDMQGIIDTYHHSNGQRKGFFARLFGN